MKSSSMSGKRRVSNVILKATSICVLLLLVLWSRVFYGSMEDYNKGEALLKENQTIRAITYFDRSLHWYAPLNPYVERSAKRLWEIGEQAEKAGDKRLALIAYESIRNGFYGASHVFRPGRNWIQRSESKIQSLSTFAGEGEPVLAKKDPQPDVLWSGVVVVGFFGSVGSLLGLARWAIGKEKRSGRIVHRAILWIGLAMFFFGLWILGLALA
jgi:hypothetical protein